MRGTLDRDLSHLAPLDAAPVVQAEQTTDSAITDGGTDKLTSLAAPKVMLTQEQNQPLLASMAPFQIESTRLNSSH